MPMGAFVKHQCPGVNGQLQAFSYNELFNTR